MDIGIVCMKGNYIRRSEGKRLDGLLYLFRHGNIWRKNIFFGHGVYIVEFK